MGLQTFIRHRTVYKLAAFCKLGPRQGKQFDSSSGCSVVVVDAVVSLLIFYLQMLQILCMVMMCCMFLCASFLCFAFI